MMAERKKAVAIQYDAEISVPKVVAVGQGLIAEKIIEAALAYDVPIVEDKEVVAKLARLPLGGEIPEEMYEAVAKILAFLYKMDYERGVMRRR
jgi:flagellar biosynthesis protein